MKTDNLKRVTITQEMIKTFAPDEDMTNNPIVLALKAEGFPEANEIIIGEEKIFIDGRIITPTAAMQKWLDRWVGGKSVKPAILGYYE